MRGRHQNIKELHQVWKCGYDTRTRLAVQNASCKKVLSVVMYILNLLVLRCGCSVLFACLLSVCAEKKVSELCDVDCFVTALVNLCLYATLPEEDECVEEEM